MLKCFATAALLGALALPGTAAAYNCRIPALLDATKKAVCGQVLLAGMDREETTRRAALAAKLAIDARTIVTRDRRAFIDTRNACGSDTRCLEATYRAQLRLYRQLESCAGRQGQTFCVERTTQKHRQDLHKSL
jgi:uncharacterized protein